MFDGEFDGMFDGMSDGMFDGMFDARFEVRWRVRRKHRVLYDECAHSQASRVKSFGGKSLGALELSSGNIASYWPQRWWPVSIQVCCPYKLLVHKVRPVLGDRVQTLNPKP